MLMTEHNLWFYQRLMQALRDAIAEQRLRVQQHGSCDGIATATPLPAREG